MLKHAGSKNLTIDGERFRYVVSEVGKDSNGRFSLSVIVQHAERNGARLQITGLFAERVPAFASKFYRGRSLKRPISPRDMEKMVRTASSHGWRPSEPGKPFVLEVDGRLATE